jgi:hypothetical protein
MLSGNPANADPASNLAQQQQAAYAIMRTTFLQVKFAKRYALLRIPSARKSATVGLQTAIWIDGVSVQP